MLLSVNIIDAVPLSADTELGVNFRWLLFVDCINSILDDVAEETLYVLPLVPKSYWSAPLKNLTSNEPSDNVDVTTPSEFAENTWASFVKNVVNES